MNNEEFLSELRQVNTLLDEQLDRLSIIERNNPKQAQYLKQMHKAFIKSKCCAPCYVIPSETACMGGDSNVSCDGAPRGVLLSSNFHYSNREGVDNVGIIWTVYLNGVELPQKASSIPDAGDGYLEDLLHGYFDGLESEYVENSYEGVYIFNDTDEAIQIRLIPNLVPDSITEIYAIPDQITLDAVRSVESNPSLSIIDSNSVLIGTDGSISMCLAPNTDDGYMVLFINDTGLIPADSTYRGSIETNLVDYNLNFKLIRKVDGQILIEGAPDIDRVNKTWSMLSNLNDVELCVESDYELVIENVQHPSTIFRTRTYAQLASPFIISYNAGSIESANSNLILEGASGRIVVTINGVPVRAEDAFGVLNISTPNVLPGSILKVYGFFEGIVVQHEIGDFIYDVVSFGSSPLTNFQLGNNLRHVPTVLPSTVTNLNHAFDSQNSIYGYQPHFTGLDVIGWDVSKVASFDNAFLNCRSLQSTFDHWDYGEALEISSMFAGSNLSRGTFSFPKVITAQNAFSYITVTGTLEITYGIANYTETTHVTFAENSTVIFNYDKAQDVNTAGIFSYSIFNNNSRLAVNVVKFIGLEAGFARSSFNGDVTLDINVSSVVDRTNLFTRCNTDNASTYTLGQLERIAGVP